MKTSILAIPFGILVTCSALQLRDAGPNPKVVHLETIRQETLVVRDLEKRDANGSISVAVPQNLVNKINYVINVTLGTPPQSFGLALDTGSADFIVRTTASAACMAGNCTAFGSFDPTTSSSYVPRNIPINETYGEGTYANGTLASETLSFGGVTLTNFTIGAVDQSTIQDNVFGIGYPQGEATNANSPPYNYRNGASAMKDAGLIEATAYSVWLNDIGSQGGSVLFGGVDTAKLTGPLQTVPVVPASFFPAGSPNAGQPFYNFLQVSLDGVATSQGSKTTLSTPAGFPISVLLDTGTTACFLPPQVVTNLCNAFSCTVQSPNYLLPCTTQGAISFNLSGINITVPLSDFLRTNGYSGGMCQFDIQPSTDPTSYILGETFLRSSYVVYNLEANEIAIAQAVVNTTASNILQITNQATANASGANYYSTFGIPSAVNASNIRTGIPTATGTFQPAVTNGAGVGASVGVGAAGVVCAGLFAVWAGL